MTSRPRPRTLRLFAPAVVALLAFGGMACSGDDGDEDTSPSTPSSEVTTTIDDDGDGSTTTDDDDDDDGEDDGSTTTEGDDGTTTTTGGSGGPGGDLTSRLPAIAGYERDIDDDDDEDGFTGEHCDGSARSVDPVEQASADYTEEGDGPSLEYLSISVMRFASEGDASSSYSEFADTTSGCTQEGLTVGQGSPSDIGDEGMSWALTFDQGAAGAIYLSQTGDELWFLVMFSDATVGEPVLAAFTGAVEG